MRNFLQMAAEVALPTINNDPRLFWLGAVGIREDGAVVASKNGAVQVSRGSIPIDHYHKIPSSHAEGRVLRKLGKNGILYVARVAKINRALVMSAPCLMCSTRIRAAKVKKVYFTINPYQYGIWFVEKDLTIVKDYL